jgi:hypothetical protein
MSKLTVNIEEVTLGLDTCRKLLKARDEDEKVFNEEISVVRSDISDTVDHLQLLLDSNRKKLLNDLKTTEENRQKKLQHMRVEIEQRISLLEGLEKYSKELIEKGAVVDTALAYRALCDRTKELTKLDDIERMLAELGSLHVQFTPVKLSDNLVGTIDSLNSKAV